jgi:hypothetical protein
MLEFQERGVAQVAPDGLARAWERWSSDGKSVWMHRFPSFGAYVTEGRPHGEGERAWLRSRGLGGHVAWHDEGGQAWTFGPEQEGYPQTTGAVLEAIRGGKPPEALERAYAAVRKGMKTKVAALSERARTLRPMRVWRIDDGNEADADRVLSGDPAFWRGRRRGAARPSITLALGIGQSCSEDAASFARIAALATAAAEVIEASGVAVRIVAAGAIQTVGDVRSDPAHGIPDCRGHVVFSFPVKRHDEATVSRRVLALGMPSVLRTFGFECMTLRFGLVGGLGMPWVPEATGLGGDVRAALGITHWIGKAPNDEGRQVEALEGIVNSVLGTL